MMWTEDEAKEYFAFLRTVRKNYIEKWSGKMRQDPYKFGFSNGGMTHIESTLWHAIRALGLEMYPQFPVGKYYLDFANPFYKIGLEADGAIHKLPQIITRDEQRTKELNDAGWKIIRLNSRDLYTPLFNTGEEGYEYSEFAKFILRLRKRTTPKRKTKVRYQDNPLFSSVEFCKQLEAEEALWPKRRERNKELFGMTMPRKEVSYKYE